MGIHNSGIVNAHDFLKKALDAMPGGVIVYRADQEQKILFANQQVWELYGCKNFSQFMEFCGGTFRGMIHPEDVNLVEREISAQIRLSGTNFDHVRYRMIDRQGNIRSIEDFGRFVEDPDFGSLFYVFLVDASVRNIVFETDFLTGFPGREWFLRYTEKRMKDPRFRYSDAEMLYLNICNFKMFNLHYGSGEGDRLLRRISEILRDAFPFSMISRFTDDHFLILQESCVKSDVLKKIIDQISQLNSQELLSCKIGVYRISEKVTPQYACDMARMAGDSIKLRADVHVMEFTPELRKMAEKRDYIVQHLDEAIENGELKVYYQPIIRSVTGTLCGAEALSRWEDPEYGFISPAEFIPVLEESRLIFKLDQHVIRTVCADLRGFLDRGIGIVPVSVNISRMDFSNMDIYGVLEDCMREYRLPHNMVNIEITESILAERVDLVEQQMDRLHRAGHRVIMDDFGSGFSSLNVLKNYDFDEIKLDMDFLTGFSQKSKDILTYIVGMAKKIGVRTLAEGVEKEEEFNFLRSIGCEKIQGYYFCRPLPAEEAMEVCREKNIQKESSDYLSHFEDISALDFLQNKSMAIFLYCSSEQKVHYLYADEEYCTELGKLYIERRFVKGSDIIEAVEKQINELDYPLKRSFLQKLSYIAEKDGFATFEYPLADSCLTADYQLISRYGDTEIYISHMEVRHIQTEKGIDNLDLLRRNLYYLYDDIYVIDFDEETAYSIASLEDEADHSRNSCGISQMLDQIMHSFICTSEYEKFRQFADLDTLEERIRNAKEDVLTAVFHARENNSAFPFKLHRIIRAQSTSRRMYLYFISGIDLPAAAHSAFPVSACRDQEELKPAESDARISEEESDK